MLQAFCIPMRTRFRGIDFREGALWQGDAGWAEFSPFWDYNDVDSAPWLAAAHEAAAVPWPAPLRSHIPVNATIPAVGPQRAAELMRMADGCRVAKVKVAQAGQSLAEEADRLAAVRDVLGTGGAIRIDANAAWDLDTAVEHLAVLDRAAGGLEYAEQPCRSVEDLARLRRRTHVPIAADESIRRASDPLAVARAGGADIAVFKVAPLGGVWACLELAEAIGLPVVVSSALETSIGLAAGLALAAALPELPFACGLGTLPLLSADVVADPLVPVAGQIEVRRPSVVPEVLDVVSFPVVNRRWVARTERIEAVS